MVEKGREEWEGLLAVEKGEVLLSLNAGNIHLNVSCMGKEISGYRWVVIRWVLLWGEESS